MRRNIWPKIRRIKLCEIELEMMIEYLTKITGENNRKMITIRRIIGVYIECVNVWYCHALLHTHTHIFHRSPWLYKGVPQGSVLGPIL